MVTATLAGVVVGCAGHGLSGPPAFIAPVWPATGFAIWVILWAGRRSWPVVAVAAVVAALLSRDGVTVSGLALLGAGAACEGLAGAWLWRTLQQRLGPAGGLADAISAVVVAPLAAAVGASCGLVALRVDGLLPPGQWMQSWLAWWSGDTLGAMIVVPLFLAGTAMLHAAQRWEWGPALRGLGVAAAAMGVVAYACLVPEGGMAVLGVFPMLLLGAAWLGVVGVRALAAAILVAIVVGTHYEVGPFVEAAGRVEVLELQVFFAMVALTCLVLPTLGHGRRLVLPGVVLLGGWALCAWIFVTLDRETRRRSDALLESRIAAAQTSIEVRFADYIHVLQGGVALFAADETISRGQWRSYTAALDLEKNYPGINGLGVIFPVAPDRAGEWLARAQADGIAISEIRPFPATTGSPEETKFVITYCEPAERNRVSVGRNIATETSRRVAAELARDTGAPQINRRIRGSRDSQRRPGFLLYLPLYRSGAPLATVAQRRAAHYGWVYAQYFADNFLKGVLGPLGDKLELHFFEAGGLEREFLLYASRADLDGALPRFARVTQLELAGQRFQLGWRRGRAFGGEDKTPVLLTAVGFNLTALLLAGLVAFQQSSRLRAEELVHQRTAELERAQGELVSTVQLQQAIFDSTRYSIISTSPTGLIVTFNAGAEQMLGWRSAELVGIRSPEVLHLPEEMAQRAATLSAELGEPVAPGFAVIVARVRRGEVEEREWTYVRRDGTRLPVMLSVTALRSRQGEITGYLAIGRDITWEKAAELELRTSKERLATIFSAVADGIIQHDEAGAIVECNAAAERILGLTREQLIGRTTPDLRLRATKEDGSSFGAAELPPMLTLRTGTPQRGTVLGVSRPDGTRVWISVQTEPLFDPLGHVKMVILSFSDITERRRIGRELADQEARLRLVVNEMPVGVRWVRSIDGRVESVLNPAHEQITGVSAAEQDQPGVYLTRTHPDDVTVQEQGMKRLRRGETGSFSMEKRYLEPDGRVRWAVVTWTRRQLPGPGNFEELSTVMEITAKKEAELTLRATLREVGELRAALDAHALVLVTDLQGRITHVNSRFCEFSKYTPAELIGQSPRLVNSGAHSPQFFAELWETITQGQVWRGELRNRAKDGTEYWVSSAVVPSLDDKGRVVRYVAIQIDITERKRLEESLARARDQALEASRMKSEFMATISHEIRTPMNAVLGMAELLADTPLNDEQAEMLATLCSGAETLLTLINDILDFSRIEAGRLRLEPSDFDFRRVVEEVVALLGPQAQAKHLELTCEFGAARGWLVLGDGGRVRQIATNLIGNAIKFTERGEVAVVVTARHAGADDSRLRLRLAVRDTGIGIAKATQAKLFQPFVQGDGSTTRRFGGSGLGLAISRQLVELMGGQIGFESEAGKGSVFWFEVDFTRRSEPEVPALPALPAGRRALIVDDNETNRRVLRGQLTRLGMESHAVASGAEGLACLRDPKSGPWHVVLLDWHMPDQSGLEVAVAIRADPEIAAVPLVMLSSVGKQVEPDTMAAVGFAAVLNKPVLDGPLARCLARVVSATAAAPNLETSGVAPRLGGLRILVAEDNPANQRVATLLLKKLGHVPEVAVNGAEALTKLAAKDFDVVLMDCQMPVLDGYEASRRIRSRVLPGINARIPIIALTAYARPEDRAKCLAAGMDDYVSKPLRGRALQEAFQRCGFGPAPDSAAAPAAGPSSAVFDVEALQTTRDLPGLTGASLLRELVIAYLENEAQRRAQLARLAEENKWEELAELAHAFGGEAAAFGGARVREAALELEDAARRQNWAEVDAGRRMLEAACDRLRVEIDRLNLAGN